MTPMRAVFTLLLFLATSPAAAAPSRAPITRATAPVDIARAAVRDSFTTLGVNELGLHITNFGALGSGFRLGDVGLEWPRGTGHNILYAGGLWIGALVAGDTLVTVAEYSHEYAAGPIGPDHLPVDPSESDPANKLYRISAGDNASNNPDYANWPVALGAPVDDQGRPLQLGDRMLWCVYNDGVASRHTNSAGGTAPLGLEVRQTVFAFARRGPLDRTAFVIFDLVNRGTNQLDDAYAGWWFDADLGGAGGDLVGCDTTLGLGFVYNADDDDNVYGAHPPAFGCVILEGPFSNGYTHSMTAFGRLLKDANEPRTPGESYRRLAGVLPAAFPGNCGGATTFEVSGDPVAGTGCLDDSPADRRFMLSTGPFSMAPGDSQRVAVALVVGGLVDGGDRLDSVWLLRIAAHDAQILYATGFESVPPRPPPPSLSVERVWPNPAADWQVIELGVASAPATHRIRIYDITGREIWKRDVAFYSPGPQSVLWDGRDEDGREMPAAVYFVSVDDGASTVTKRIVRLK